MLGSLYTARSLLALSFIAQIALGVHTLVVLINSFVLAIIVPRVTLVDYHLVVSVQVGGVVTSLGQYLCRHPAAIVLIVE